ncbi:MAG: pseudouridine synthase [bacterium]|nr:pseudouridine synthase [bacterium]
MEVTKKPKRPRIGESQELNAEAGHFEKVTYNPNSAFVGTRSIDTDQATSTPADTSAESSRPEYRRNNYNQNNYNNRQGGYNNYNNRQGGYNNYNNRQGGYDNSQEGGYNNRQQSGYNNRQQGGYNRQGGYNNRQQGGYNRQGGYNNYNNRPQGGYNNYNQEGGFGNRQQGGYNRQGGYNNRQQGGYNNRQGGYNNRQQGGYNNRQGGFINRPGGYNNRPQAGKKFTPRPKQIIYDMPEIDPMEEIRLNKFMANAGVCSRREADELITGGKVKVNGEVVTELGTKIKHTDVVEYDEKVVTLENKCYILLNKPKDCVTTSSDPDGRLTVMDIVKNACKERIYPVGRLDRNTTGVLLLTNDGDLASKLTHPKFVKKKIYHVWTDKDIAEDDMQRLADGVELDDGPIQADEISYVNDHDKNQAGIEIHSGRNRIVRRMFESLGYRVTKLDRVYFAGLTKKNLPRGRWRYLTQEEVNYLKSGSFE